MTIYAYCPDMQDFSWWTDYKSGTTHQTTGARTGTYAIRLVSAAFGNNQYVTKSVASGETWYTKTGVYFSSPTTTNQLGILFRESSTTHVEVRFDPGAGSITAYRGGTSVATATAVIGIEKIYCIEVKVVVHDSTGVIQVKVDGVLEIDFSGDTRNGGSGVIDNIKWQASSDNSSSLYAYLSDIVIRDDGWPGLGGLNLLVPTGNGTNTAWTGTYADVDELPPSFTDDIDTDAGTTTTKETYTHAGLAASAYDSIAFVAVQAVAKLDGAGSGNIRSIVKSGSTYGNGSSTALTTSAAWVELYQTTDPDTASAWTKAGVGSAEFGVETI